LGNGLERCLCIIDNQSKRGIFEDDAGLHGLKGYGLILNLGITIGQYKIGRIDCSRAKLYFTRGLHLRVQTTSS
jgi:hypothetical protein